MFVLVVIVIIVFLVHTHRWCRRRFGKNVGRIRRWWFIWFATERMGLGVCDFGGFRWYTGQGAFGATTQPTDPYVHIDSSTRQHNRQEHPQPHNLALSQIRFTRFFGEVLYGVKPLLTRQQDLFDIGDTDRLLDVFIDTLSVRNILID